MSSTKLKSGSIGSDLAMAALVVAIVGLMILPLPVIAIDALLAVNLSISVLLLITTLFIPNAVALSSFPSLLLFTTLFRLSLNIASTKSILLHAEAGHLIESFGELVIGGNLVVGIVVFLIIIVVQFIVISKGSERVAEVGARFTLDAMPGKQMSIDADMRNGHITAEEAQYKRAHLAMESQLHGGMDGAMKFVKGDAIAGLVIAVVNMLGGIAVGVMYHGMTAGQAANRFAVLSIGDAMVTAIPSLFICVAAGVLITRVADENQKKPRSLGQEILSQLTSNTRAMYIAAALVLAFAAIPGFPLLPFLLLSVGLALAARTLDRTRRSEAALAAPIQALQGEGAKGLAPSILSGPPPFARPLAVRLSTRMAAELNTLKFDTALAAQRSALQARLGLPFPGVTMWVSDELPAASFEVLLNDVPLRLVEVPAGLCWLSDISSPLAAQAQKHGPLLHQAESLWIAPELVSADQKPLCLSTEEVMARQVMALLNQHAHVFVGIQEVQRIIESMAPDYPGLASEVQKIMPLSRIAEVLRRLLEEQVPIRNLRSIFESLITWGPKEKDVLMLTEYVRGDLGSYLAFEAGSGQPFMHAILLDPAVEQSIRQCVKTTPNGNYLAMPPEQAAAITAKVEQICAAQPNTVAALVIPNDIRRYVKKIVESRLAGLRVYSYQELAGLIEMRPIGRVTP
jgi:type III secretion protein V